VNTSITSSAGSSRRARRSQKLREPDPAAALPLGQQQRGDEEAGEDEERVHAEEAAGQPRDAAVEEQYRGRRRARARRPAPASR
jgi:hypothetical protein